MSSFATFQQNSIAPANPTPQQGLLSKIGSSIGNAFNSGINEIGSGYNQAANASKNPSLLGGVGDLIGGASHMITGAGAALASPLAPITQPLGSAVNAVGNSIGDNPTVQNFANSSVGQATSDVAGAISQGANTLGTVAGGMGVADLGGNIWSKAYGDSSKVLDSRIADATPAYNKDLVGQNVKTPGGDIVPRVNEGEGITGKRTVNTSISEAQSGQELANLKDYPDKGTALEKSQSIGQGINTEAESMRSGLQAEDKATPLDVNAEKIKVSNLVRSNLPEEIQAKVGVNTPEENTMLKGMSEKAGSPIPEGGKYDLRGPGEPPNLPRTAAGRYYAKVLDALNEYDGTREGKLDLRQSIDKAYQSEGGKYAYGSDSQNALDETNTDIRDALNKDLADTTKNTDTQASLKKQTNLFRAKDVLDAKAKAESPSSIERFFQQHPITKSMLRRTATGFALSAAGYYALRTQISNFEKSLVQ